MSEMAYRTREEQDRHTLYSRIKDLEAEVELRAKVENAHLLCAAYPVTCPDCGYKWKSGLLSLAAALFEDGEK